MVDQLKVEMKTLSICYDERDLIDHGLGVCLCFTRWNYSDYRMVVHKTVFNVRFNLFSYVEDGIPCIEEAKRSNILGPWDSPI